MIRSNAFASKLMSQKQFNNQILILFLFFLYENSIGINNSEYTTKQKKKQIDKQVTI